MNIQESIETMIESRIAPMQMEISELKKAIAGFSAEARIANKDKKPANVEQAYFTIEDAACFSGLSNDSIRKLLSKKLLTPFRPVAGRTLVSRSEIESLLKSSANLETSRGKSVIEHQKTKRKKLTQ